MRVLATDDPAPGASWPSGSNYGWVDSGVLSVPGPTGPAGAPGPAGPTGPTGPAGVNTGLAPITVAAGQVSLANSVGSLPISGSFPHTFTGALENLASFAPPASGTRLMFVTLTLRDTTADNDVDFWVGTQPTTGGTLAVATTVTLKQNAWTPLVLMWTASFFTFSLNCQARAAHGQILNAMGVTGVAVGAPMTRANLYLITS